MECFAMPPRPASRDLRGLAARVTVEGVVASGRSQARVIMNEKSRELRALVGVDLQPGSLNLVLEEPLRLVTEKSVRFDRDLRYLWKAQLVGSERPVWIYRWRGCPLHVCEIVSPVHLRTDLGLADGDRMTLIIEAEVIGRVGQLARVVWSLLWQGRQHHYYGSESYRRAVYFTRLHMLAAQ